MRFKRIFASLASCLLLLTCESLPAFAEVALPPGAVKGLPERLAALDSEGNAVNSATGEYFFRMEDMNYGETYTKSVQLMNLREDYAYHIYFNVEPLYKKGSIDLEKGCECTFWLDGKEFYKGTVTGQGNFDLNANVYDTGLYFPGDSHTLKCSVVWNDLAVLDDVHVNNGHRLVDKNGTHVLEGPDESGHVEGEIEFKWIFYARVNPGDETVDIQTTTDIGLQTSDTNVTTTERDGKQTTDTAVTTTEWDGKQTTDNRVTDTGIIGGTTVATDVTETKIHGGQDTTPSTDPRHTTTVTTVIPPGGYTPGSPGTPGTPNTPSTPSNFFSPLTGYLAKDGKVWLIGMGVVGVMIFILLILMHREKQKRKRR